MQLQGAVAGLQGQTPAWRDSRTGAPSSSARRLIRTRAGEEAGGRRPARPPLSSCVTLGRPSASLGLPSHPSATRVPSPRIHWIWGQGLR